MLRFPVLGLRLRAAERCSRGAAAASCRDAALRAAQAVRAHIGPDGLVGQVSYGTIVADTLEYYKNVPLRPTGYGQNLALMMLVELLVWDAQGLL